MKHLECWFEFASTYSYLSVMRIEAACAQAGVGLIWRPFLLGPVFAGQGLRDSPFKVNPVKGAYMWRDMERSCMALGLQWRQPTEFPRGSLLAARIAVGYSDAPWLGDFIRAVYYANFAQDADICDVGVITGLLSAAGLDAQDIIARATTPEVKAALKEQTSAAINRGIFGAPTFTVGDEVFWGNDRLEMALDYACGQG